MLLKEFIRGAKETGAHTEEIIAGRLNLEFCRGCLKCNLLKRCAIRNDEWESISNKILDANSIVIASPVYFHHVSSPVKRIIDRFRSFIHVQITEKDLKHTPWNEWKKHFVLIMSQGSPDMIDARPVIDLLKFITKTMGPGNMLTSIIGTRLAVSGQVNMNIEDLKKLYPKLGLPVHLAETDYLRNRKLIKKCYNLGKKLGQEKTDDNS